MIGDSSGNGAATGKRCSWCHRIVELTDGNTATDGICKSCALKLVQGSFISGTPDDEAGPEGGPAESLPVESLEEEYGHFQAPPDTEPIAQEPPVAVLSTAEAAPPLDAPAIAPHSPPAAPPTTKAARQDAPPDTQGGVEGPAEVQWLLLKLGHDLGFDVRLADAMTSRLPDSPAMKPDLPYQLDGATQNAIDVIDVLCVIDVLWMKEKRVVAAFEITSKLTIHSSLLKLSDLIAVWPYPNFQIYLVASDDGYNQLAAEAARFTFALLSPPMTQACRFISLAELGELVTRLGQFVRYLRPDFLEQLARKLP